MSWQEVKVLNKKVIKGTPDSKTYDTVRLELEMPFATWQKLKHVIEAPSYLEPHKSTEKKTKRKRKKS